MPVAVPLSFPPVEVAVKARSDEFTGAELVTLKMTGTLVPVTTVVGIDVIVPMSALCVRLTVLAA